MYYTNAIWKLQRRVCIQFHRRIYEIKLCTQACCFQVIFFCLILYFLIKERCCHGKHWGRVKKVIAEKLGVDEATIKNDASFVEDLGADSLDTVELVMALEEEFGIEIPDEDAEKMATVGDAVKYIEEKIAKK